MQINYSSDFNPNDPIIEQFNYEGIATFFSWEDGAPTSSTVAIWKNRRIKSKDFLADTQETLELKNCEPDYAEKQMAANPIDYPHLPF